MFASTFVRVISAVAVTAGLPLAARGQTGTSDPSALTFGNSPRSLLRGPSLVTTDLTLEKAFALLDRHSLDGRIEAYNLLNRTNFNPPGPVFGTADFGVISSARSARTIQLGARVSF